MKVVYEHAHMQQVDIQKDLPYKRVNDHEFLMDAYYPPDMHSETKLPAVIFIHGESAQNTPMNMKDSGQYTSWGRLAAASGMIGITFNHRASQECTKIDEPEKDIEGLISYVRTHLENVDKDTIGIWLCSGAGIYGLRVALKDHPSYIRCIVSYYATMDLLTYRDSLPRSVTDKTLQEFSGTYYLDKQPEKIAPLLIVRAGLDRGKNHAIDTFIAKALANNVAIEIINYPEGHHGFDVVDDTNKSRTIIQRTLTFLKGHLTS